MFGFFKDVTRHPRLLAGAVSLSIPGPATVAESRILGVENESPQNDPK